MDALTIISILWLLFIFAFILKKDGRRGILLILFILIGAFLASSGNKFGYDGENLSIAFLIVVVVSVLSAKYFKKKQSLSSPQQKSRKRKRSQQA